MPSCSPSSCLAGAFVVCSLLGPLSVVAAPPSVRKIARINGQIIIGGLFPIHEQPTIKSAFTRQCGRVREQYGMHRVEVFMKTIQEINDKGVILPNITLGLDIRDTCWYPPVALEQSIDFIRNSLVHLDRNTGAENASASGDREQRSDKPECVREVGKPIASLIGPASSSVTIQVQNLLQLFKIPQIGYSATSMDLSKKEEYGYFLRVVPPDNLQAKVLRDIVIYYKWKYLSLLNSKGNYGVRGMEEFKQAVGTTEVCFDQEDAIDNKEDLSAFEALAQKLFNHTNPARVVICFCQGETVRKLFIAMKNLNLTKKGYLIVGSDGWADRPDVLGDMVDSRTQRRTMSDHVLGGISIRLHSPKVPDFDEYFWSLKPRPNNANPWFNEFWEQKFNCTFTRGGAKGVRICTGKESLNSSDYRQDTKLGFVVNSVYTVAHGLKSMLRELCGPKRGICKGFLPVNGTILLRHLLNVSFETYSGENLHFDGKGDPPGRYDIMNYRSWRNDETGEVRYDYVQVGHWQQGNLSLNDSNIMWPLVGDTPVPQKSVTSICAKPCQPGAIKVISIEKQKCCWKCRMCKDNEVVDIGSREERCRPCKPGMRPSSNRKDCVEIEVEYMQWHDTQAIVSMVFACVGIFFTLGVLYIVARYNNTPVIKASTRELLYFILAGLILSYCTTFVLIARPTITSCYLSRILPGISFSLIYGALVTKTNRIARILAGSKKKIMTRKPRFLSTTAQIVITCLLIAIECSIIAAMLIVEPADEKRDYSRPNRVILICNTTSRGVIVPLGFDAVLICLCTVYAIRTRNLPENFNEAKFIGFTMYTTCVVWIGFVSIYFGSDNKVTAMCIAMSLSAYVALVLLFLPKVYIILCKPEKNQRSAFTTSKDIRCHIGPGRQSSSKGTDQSKGLEPAALSVFRQRNCFDRFRSGCSRNDSSNSEERPLGNRGAAGDSASLKGAQLGPIPTRSSPPPRRAKLCHDSWVQTDDDLVAMSIRRRRPPSRSSRDAVDQSACSNCGHRSCVSSDDGEGEEEGAEDGGSGGGVSGPLSTAKANHTETQPLIHSAMAPASPPAPSTAKKSSTAGIDATVPLRRRSSTSRVRSAVHPSLPPPRLPTARPLPHFPQPPCSSSPQTDTSVSSSSEILSPERLSIEELSVLGLNLLEEEETSAQRFSTYLRSHGVELDLDTVQTSEV